MAINDLPRGRGQFGVTRMVEPKRLAEVPSLLHFNAQTVLMPDRSKVRADDAFVAGARAALQRADWKMLVHLDVPHLIVQALTDPQELEVVAQQRIRRPVLVTDH